MKRPKDEFVSKSGRMYVCMYVGFDSQLAERLALLAWSTSLGKQHGYEYRVFINYCVFS